MTSEGPLAIGSVDELRALVGTGLGTSGWLAVTQSDVDAFAEVTGERGWMHVDPVRAAASPFGATIVPGLLTLALVPRLLRDVVTFDGFADSVVNGTEQVRFPAPLPVGGRIRLHATLDRVERSGGLQVQLGGVLESDRAARPVCVAELLVRLFQR